MHIGRPGQCAGQCACIVQQFLNQLFSRMPTKFNYLIVVTTENHKPMITTNISMHNFVSSILPPDASRRVETHLQRCTCACTLIYMHNLIERPRLSASGKWNNINFVNLICKFISQANNKK